MDSGTSISTIIISAFVGAVVAFFSDLLMQGKTRWLAMLREVVG